MTRPPNFHELFDEPMPEEERDKLLRAHELVVDAGPRPEVPPWLEQPPSPWDDGVQAPFSRPKTAAGFMRRRRMRSRTYALLSLAAALALLAFFAGYTAKSEPASFKTQFTLPMHGTPAARDAIAAILVAPKDPAGNWPMLLRVEGLQQLPPGGYYELYLSRHGKPAASCGTFRVTSNVTEVRLNAPYNFHKFTGWVVTRHLPGVKGADRILLRTRTV